MTIWWISIVLQNSTFMQCLAFLQLLPIFSAWNFHECEIHINLLISRFDLRFGAIKNFLMFKKNITPINITMWTCCLRINKFTEMIFSFTKISKSQTTLISKVIRKSVGGSGGGFISTWTRINFDRLDFLYERELIVKGN